MLDGGDRRLQRWNSSERRVQLGARPLRIKLVAATCFEPLQRHVERVLLILGVPARHLKTLLSTAQVEVGNGQLGGEQHLKILDIFFRRGEQGATALRRLADATEDV